MAGPGLGYNVLGALRLVNRVPASGVWPVIAGGSVGTAVSHSIKLGYYDQLPITKEAISHNSDYDQDNTLDGDAGIKRMDKISDLPGGPLDLNGFYIGLDAILAMTMGFEKWRNGTAAITADPQTELESPVFGVCGLGTTLGLMTTAAGTTGSTLASAGTEFTNDNLIGDWVRIIDNTASAHTFDQVRKITARGSTSSCTVAPAWVTDQGANPVASKKFEVAREFLHTFEFSRNLHGELYSDVLAGNWNPGIGRNYLTRSGILAFQKGVSYWELQYAMINKLVLKLDAKAGLTINVEFLGLYLDLANTNSQNSAAWYWVNASSAVPTFPAALSGAQFGVPERVVFPEGTFRIDSFSTSSGALSSSDDLPISSCEITIDNKLKGDDQDTKTTYRRTEPVRSDKRSVTLNFEIPRYLSNTRIDNYRNENDLMGRLNFAGSTIATGKTNELYVHMPRFRLKPVKAETAGANPLTEKVEAVCLQCTPETGYPNSAEFPQPTSGLEKGELIIRTRNQNPFNAFMKQNVEY